MKTVSILAACLLLGVGAFGGFCPAIEQPPPLPTIAPAVVPPPFPPADCRRCDILERKLDALIELLIRKGVIDGPMDSRLDEMTGGEIERTRMKSTPAMSASPPVFTAPLVLLPGTNQLGHGPYLSKAFKPTGASEGRWWSYKRCHGSSCTIEYYWVPEGV